MTAAPRQGGAPNGRRRVQAATRGGACWASQEEALGAGRSPCAPPTSGASRCGSARAGRSVAASAGARGTGQWPRGG
eukprot:6622320-Alexandrium_andersonii.AAC.1